MSSQVSQVGGGTSSQVGGHWNRVGRLLSHGTGSVGYQGRAESGPQIKEGDVGAGGQASGVRGRSSRSQKVPAGSVGSKLSYSAWTQVFLNQTGPPVELRVEHLLPDSMSKAWEHWEARAGVEN